MAKQQSAQDLVNENYSAQDYIPKKSSSIKRMSNVENRQMARKVQQQVRTERVQKYRAQPNYGGLTKNNVVTSLKRINPIQGNFREGYSVQRLPVTKRRIPGQPMVRQESVQSAVRFISGRGPSSSQGYSRPGRPKGSFYKYSILGVGPVDVFTHRRWLRNQQRLLAAQLQQQNPGLSYNQAKAQIKQAGVQNPQVMIQNPRQAQIMQPQPMQQPYPQQIQMARPPFDDGWGLLRIKSPFSMTGNSMPAVPINPIANAQAPVGNRNTSYYSEPDFLSGQQVMKQRPNIGGFGLW